MPPSGVDPGAWPAAARIDQLLACHAARTPAAPCTTFGACTEAYAEVDARVDALARRLRDLGLDPGDRVAVLCTPRPEYLLCLMAISRAGAVYVGLQPRYTAAEVAQVLERVRPRLLLALRSLEGQAFAPLLAQAAGLAPLPPVAWFDSPAGCLEALQALPDDVLPPAGPAPDPGTARALPGTAAIVFTSGTTGRPKAAMLTHAGLLLAARVQQQRLGPARPRGLCHLPINHVGCLMNLTLAMLVDGGSIVFQERFDPGHTLQLLVAERITCWLQVPAMFHACVQHPAWAPEALGHLHSICIGGGAPSAATNAALRRTGARLFVEYGQTETASSASYSDADASDEVLAHSIGRFDPHFEFRIADAAHRPCAVGAVGEIQGRGPLVFAGYFGDEPATRDAFTPDGWLHTGDLATLRPDGNIRLVGRLKEMVKTGGHNVYPREVELVLAAHPAVADVVVLGLPDAHYGEAVHAVLVWRGAARATRAELDALCRQSLANYKVPKSVRTLAALPLLPNGKVDRVATRALAAGLSAID